MPRRALTANCFAKVLHADYIAHQSLDFTATRKTGACILQQQDKTTCAGGAPHASRDLANEDDLTEATSDDGDGVRGATFVERLEQLRGSNSCIAASNNIVAGSLLGMGGAAQSFVQTRMAAVESASPSEKVHAISSTALDCSRSTSGSLDQQKYGCADKPCSRANGCGFSSRSSSYCDLVAQVSPQAVLRGECLMKDRLQGVTTQQSLDAILAAARVDPPPYAGCPPDPTFPWEYLAVHVVVLLASGTAAAAGAWLLLFRGTVATAVSLWGTIAANPTLAVQTFWAAHNCLAPGMLVWRALAGDTPRLAHACWLVPRVVAAAAVVLACGVL